MFHSNIKWSLRRERGREECMDNCMGGGQKGGIKRGWKEGSSQYLFLEQFLYIGLEVVLLDAFGLHHQPVMQLAQPLQHTGRSLVWWNMAVSTVQSWKTYTHTHTHTYKTTCQQIKGIIVSPSMCHVIHRPSHLHLALANVSLFWPHWISDLNMQIKRVGWADLLCPQIKESNAKKRSHSFRF